MMPKDTDPIDVLGVFDVVAFKSKAWLESLDNESLKKYCDFMERVRGTDRVIDGTVGFICEFKALSERVGELNGRQNACFEYLKSLVTED